MGEPTQIRWRIAGEEFASCNCNWGCPCQFNALPTTGRCEAFVTCLISDGYFADTRLDGVVFSRIYWWPRAIHEGNGLRRMIIDEQATKKQRDALIAIESGQHGGLTWEISAAVAPSRMETLFAPISFKVDRDKRRAMVRIPGMARTDIEPIKNPVTGEEHRARIVLPDGFEYKAAEMGNTVYCRVSAGEQLAFELKNTYGQLNAFDSVENCNCSWGCSCQFLALPTTGQCEAFLAGRIGHGYFGDTRLDGVVFSRIFWRPGAIHEGNGVRRMIIDEQAHQRAA